MNARGADTAEDGLSKKIGRWNWFWSQRNGGNDAATAGNMGEYLKGVQQLINTESEFCMNDSPHHLAWELKGPKSQSEHRQGRVDIVTTDPTNQAIVYAGTPSSGLWRCNDIETETPQWKNITDHIYAPSMGVIDFKIHPINPNVAYISFGYVNGVSGIENFSIGLYKTTNLTSAQPEWTKILPTDPNEIFSKIHHIQIDQFNPSSLLVINENLLLKSDNNGTSFTTLHDFELNLTATNKDLSLTALIQDKYASNIYFVVGKYKEEIDDEEYIDKASLWKCTLDAGNSITIEDITDQISPLYPLQLNLFYSPIRLQHGPNGTYAMFQIDTEPDNNTNSITTQIYKTSNGGINWQYFTEFETCNKMAVFGMSPTDENIFYLEGSTNSCGALARMLIKTTNAGASFITVTEYNADYPYNGTSTHADIRGFHFIEGSADGLSDKILCASDGGILYSESASPSYVNWKDINGEGLAITQFWGIGQRYDDVDEYGGGVQDNHTLIYMKAGFWEDVSSGDGYDLLYEKSNSKYAYNYRNGGTHNFLKSSDYAISFNWALSNDQSSDCKQTWNIFRQPIYNDYSDHVFTAYHDIYMSNDHFSTKTAISDFSNENQVPENWLVEAICAFPHDNNIMYASFRGATWGKDFNAVTGDCQPPWDSIPSGSPAKKVFKSTNAISENPTWVDITPNITANGDNPLHAVSYRGVVDLTISNSNLDIVFVCFGSISPTGDDYLNGYTRVIRSTDGGQTWIDYSDGLPAFPVNRIMHYDGSNNGLFAGTDYGIYYTDDDIYQEYGWICISSGLPPSIITDIDINYCRQIIRIGTWGRGLWEADLSDFGVNTDLVVDEYQTWETPREITGNIIVTNNASLTIKSQVYMASGKSITVEPGSRLYVTGGTLTNACGDLWDGIYVEGNSNKNQSATSHGQVQLTNATLENAYMGVRNFGVHPNGSTNYDKTGGIINAKHSTFLNNRWDVSFLKYQRFYTSGAPRPDRSGFYGCSFIDNDEFVEGSSPARAIGLYKVHDIMIKGCTFKDERDVPMYDKSIGIVSEGAYYTIDTYNDQPTEFSQLRYAIKSYDYAPAPIKITGAQFSTLKGVYLSGVDHAQLNHNTFTTNIYLDPNNDEGVWTPYGLYLDMCTNYQVEENHFNSDAVSFPGGLGSSVGLLVRNRHGEATQVYNNVFDGFIVATEAIGQNKSEVPNQIKGLQFLCNNFGNNKTDVYITQDFIEPTLTVGIAEEQGELSTETEDLAGNLFGNSSPILQSNYNNNGDYLFYIHHNETSEPRVVPEEYSNISLIPLDVPFNPDLSCPSHFDDGGGDDDEIKLLQALAKAGEAEGEIAEVDNQLASLVDGGNTQQLENEVATTTHSDAWIKYQELMSNAGYLSEEVLDEVSKKETGFNKAMVRNVLVANPQAAKSEKIQQNLDNRLDPLPNYMRDQIDMGLTKISAKEYLELAKATWQTRHDRAVNQALSILKADTVNNRSAEIVDLLSNADNLSYDYKLVTWYDANGQHTLADALLDVINAKPLSNTQQVFFDKYTGLRTLIQNWKEAGINMAELDEARLTQLEGYALANNTVAAKAHALLELNGVNEYTEPVYFPQPGEKSGRKTRNNRSANEENNLKLYPNPTDNYFTVEYELVDPFNKAVIVVFDPSGRVIEQMEIDYSIDQVIVPAEIWPSGNYTISVFADGHTVMTKKITITK